MGPSNPATGGGDRLRGASASTVREAIERADPLPGTSGFAGAVDGRLVRDVLGRVPLYVSADYDRNVETGESELAPSVDPATPVTDLEWGFRPTAVTNPVAVPAGIVWGVEGQHRQWSLPDPEPLSDTERAIESLAGAIETALGDVPVENAAVAFSGGVDSALLASRLGLALFVGGFPGSTDIEAAREAAESMGCLADLHVVEFDHDTLERAIPRVARAIGRTNAMDLSIALSLSLVADRVSAEGFDRLILGQGADELFGGYEKIQRLDHRVEASTVRGAVREVLGTLPAQLPRDVLAVERAGVTPVMPYLHDAVVESALALPGPLLADESGRKYGLRRVAADYLPESVATREKKAVQYGSLTARELDRLARQAGYKRRMDDHVSQYVHSLLE